MSTLREIKGISLADIEEGVTANSARRPCYQCKSKQTRLQRYIGQLKTKNFIDVCNNPPCFRHSDPSQITTWHDIDKSVPLSTEYTLDTIAEYA